MIMKWKKTLKAGITVLTTLCLLSGCAPSSKTEVLSEDGRIKITFWYSGGKTAAGVMEDIIRDFNLSQQKYLVTGVQQADYDETYTKLQAGIAGRNAADIALLDSDKSRSLAVKGLIANMNSYMEQDTAFEEEDFIPVFFNQCRLENGTTYAVPAYGTTQVMYYNRQIFEKAGIHPDSIKTWQDLAEAARRIRGAYGTSGISEASGTSEASGQAVYGWEPMWGADNLIDMALSNGGSMVSPDGTTVLINSAPWTDAWEAVRKWIHEDKTMAIHYGGQGWEYWYKTMDDMTGGRAGGYTGSSGDQADLDFTVAGAMEQPGFGDNPSAPVARVLQLVMVETGQDSAKEGVYAFMKYFSEASNQARWSMATGYIPVRLSTLENPDYKAYVRDNPHALVPLNQSMHASPDPIDPTNGKIFDALSIAADKVEIENIPAKDALDEACRTAQKALDEINQRK